MNKRDRTAAIYVAQTQLARNPVFLDTETTGTKPSSEIIEISIVDDAGLVLFDSLVKPTQRIPKDVIQIHGITDDMLIDAPRWNSIWSQVESILKENPVGIYNADFDLRMIRQSHARYWMDWQPEIQAQVFCIMKLYAQFYGEWNSARGNYRWQSLDAARSQAGLSLPNSHRAKADALLARALLHYMAESSS
jgi:DNA polymerase-3 subunit epsilon